MSDIFSYAKAIAALVGSLVIVLTTELPEGPWSGWLEIIAVVATVVATYQIPNRPPAEYKDGE